MSVIVSQITGFSVVYSTVCSSIDQRKHSKLCVTGLCEGNLPVTGEFSAQRAINAENVSIWWHHHEKKILRYWPFVWGIHWSQVNSPHKGHWHRVLMFSLIYAWTNSCANNGDNSHLRHLCAHYNITVMRYLIYASVFLCMGSCALIYCCHCDILCILRYTETRLSYENENISTLSHKEI